MCIKAAGSHHQIGLPSFDRFKSNITRRTSLFIGIITQTLFQHADRIVVIIHVKILIIRTVLVVNGSGRITHNRLTVNIWLVGGRCIGGTVLMPFLHHIQVDFQHIVKHPVWDIKTHTDIFAVSVHYHTVFLAVSHIRRVSGLLASSRYIEIMVVSKAGPADGIQPVGIISLIGKVCLACTYILGSHKFQLFAELGCRDVAWIGCSRMRLTFAVLGSDQDNPVCTPRTVNGSSRSILQHINGGNIFRSHRA